ncbi:MAG: arylesterase [Parvibaculum sp.]|nr:arylesterase [Parvibaculum sp.]
MYSIIYKQMTKAMMAAFAAAVLLYASGHTIPAQADENAVAQKPFVIVAFGDSLTAGYLLGPDEGFVPQLQKALHARGHTNVEVRDAGVSGDTTSGGLSRLDWSIGSETDAVILELGANDALRGLDPLITRQNLETMIRTLQARHIRVLLVGMLAPPNLGADYGRAFNPIYPDLAAQFDLDLYPFFLDGVAGHPSLALADGMHPNAQGIAIMVEGVLPKVENLILPLSN